MKTSSVSSLSRGLAKVGNGLSVLSIYYDCLELKHADNPKDIIYGSFDLSFDVLGAMPIPGSTTVSIAWSFGGREVAEYYNEYVFQTEINLGIAGSMQTMPFK